MSLNSAIPSGVSIALGRCRYAVIACCWLIGLALAAQMFLWSLATFTDLRFESIETKDEAPLIVHAEPEESASAGRPRPRERRAVPRNEATEKPADAADQDDDEQQSPRALSRTDQRFAGTFNLAAGFGQCAMFVLLAIVGLTVMLAAASGLSTVDRTVSSFLWLLLVAVLVLPMGNFFSLPWQHGAFTTYEHMTDSVDQIHAHRRQRIEGIEPAGDEPAVSVVEFYTRFLLLPAACIVGITLVGWRYCSSLEGSLPQRERMRFDPALEREASNITPTSLHSGRSGSVFNRAISETDSPEAREQSMPSARGVSPGEQPKRLI